MCTSDSMLTSANQYLRPEYLPPVSSPLDANKSPLALLAKTCSSIGVDTPSVKSLTGSSSNSSSSSSTNSSSNERRTTPKSKSTDSNDGSSSKLNFKPYALSNELSSRNRQHDGDRNGSVDKSTTNSTKGHGSSPASHTSPEPAKQQASSSSSSAPFTYTSHGLPDMHKDSLAAFYKAYGLFSPNCCPTTAGSPYASLMPPPITLDKTGAYPSIYPPTPSATAPAALAAYNYARVKGSMPMVPVASNPLCRDPYCGGNCGQFGPLHNSHVALLAASQASLALRGDSGPIPNQPPCTPATCPNGCNQCEHQRYMAAIAAYGGSFPGLAPGMPYPQQLQASYASSLAAAAALHHRTATNAGNVCNWIVGDTHCGKRFSTSEELLQHLKSHTASSQNSTESRTSPNTSAAPTAHLSNSSSPAVSTAPQHLSSSGTLSPLSQSARLSTSSSATAVSPSHTSHSLSLHNNNRYHPYSKPISSVAPSLPPSALASAAFPLAPNGASTPSYPHPFGLSPATSLPSFAASSMYYPYVTPGLFSGRIGPPVPP